VEADGKDVGEEMVRQGLAWVYERYITEASAEIQDSYRKAQEEAKAGKRGLWSDPNAIPPWIFRDLAKARQEQTIASNWMEGHQKSANPNIPIPQLASPSPLATPVNSADVWVNTKSGKYWKRKVWLLRVLLFKATLPLI
jgi:Staphylococcal nuclease homologue